MKFTVETKALCRIVDHAALATDRKSPNPITETLRISASDVSSTVKADGCDLDKEIASLCDARVDETGSARLNARRLDGFLKALPRSGEVTVEADETGVTVRSEMTAARFASVEDDESLKVSEIEKPSSVEIEAEALRNLLAPARHCISTEETRYYLNGVYLHPVEDGYGKEASPALRAAATDGHRMALIDAALPKGGANLPGVILPRAAVGAALAILDGHDGSVSLSVGEGKFRHEVVEIIGGGVMMRAKCIDGTFPDYRRVAPSLDSVEETMTVDAMAMASGIRRLKAAVGPKDFARYGGRSVTMIFEADYLVIQAKNRDSDIDAETVVPARKTGETPFQIAFAGAYWLEMLSAVGSGEIAISASDPRSAVLVTAKEASGARFVLMPMRVDSGMRPRMVASPAPADPDPGMLKQAA